MNGKDLYYIKSVVLLLLRHIWLLLLITVIGGTAGYCYSKYYLPELYSSHVCMYVHSNESEDSEDDINTLKLSKQLVNTYIAVLKDDAVMREIGEMLQEQFDATVIQECFGVTTGKISPGAIRGCLDITSLTDASAVQINATARNPEVAAAICNDMTKVAPDFVKEAVGVGSSIKTIDTAMVYNYPVSPNIRKYTLTGAAVGFALIVLIIFLIDFFDTTVKDSDALANKYKKAIIGEIQQFGEVKKKKKKEESNDHFKLTDKEVPFYIVESYKSIRTNVTFSLSTGEKRILAVSSPNPGEGKSTTSANIAIAMAQGGNKVLLIDADMRKSVQHKVFGIKNKRGLSTAISKMKPLEECIQKDVMENLDVLTAGPLPPNPSELLASDHMGEILDELSKKYSVIIIDTPPINVVTDAMELAKNISGIVMVVKFGITRDDEVDDAIKKIEFAQMNMLGFILNDIKHKHVGGYYSKYKYSSKYYYKKGYGYGYYGNKPELGEQDADEDETVPPLETASEEPKDTVEASTEESKVDTVDPQENTPVSLEKTASADTATDSSVENNDSNNNSDDSNDEYFEIKF